MSGRIGLIYLWAVLSALWLVGAGGYAQGAWWGEFIGQALTFEDVGIRAIAALACPQTAEDVLRTCLVPPVETWLAALVLVPPLATLLAGLGLGRIVARLRPVPATA